ncbi:hypothetical protein HDV05_002377, partial [Chytridiales sp. JEL 0842]
MSSSDDYDTSSSSSSESEVTPEHPSEDNDDQEERHDITPVRQRPQQANAPENAAPPTQATYSERSWMTHLVWKFFNRPSIQEWKAVDTSKKLKCLVCGKPFVPNPGTNSNLVTHAKTQHDSNPEDKDKDMKFQQVKREFLARYQQGAPSSSQQTLSDASSSRIFKKMKIQSAHGNPAQELITYLQWGTASQEEDVILWWKDHASRFPALAMMARDYLAIPGTSAASERVFSGARALISDTRTRLSAES